MEWYLKVLRQYADFNGRARRKEYWMFFLFNFLIFLALGLVEMVLGLGFGGVGLLSGLYALAVLIPGLAVTVRRLHDTGRSGLWILVAFIPFIGALVLLYFMVIEGNSGPNQYGPDPKGMAAPAAAAPPPMNVRPNA